MKKNGETPKPDKPKGVKKDDPEQSKRFAETAERLGYEKSGASFKKALANISDASESSPTKAHDE